MKIVLSLLAGLIVLVLAIISVQNPAPITVYFLGWQTTVLPLWVVIVAALASGMILVGMLGMPGRIQQYRTTRQLRQRLAESAVAGQPHAADPHPVLGQRDEIPVAPVAADHGAGR